MTDSSSPSSAGSTRYRIIDKLGDGGMGVVYKAEDLRLARQVALKFLLPEVEQDTHALDRFQREAQAASALNNRHICTVHDIGEQDGRTFIAMELIDGKTLKAQMAGGTLPIDATLTYAMQIAEALSAAHKHGVVHRDVKPSNIFVTRDDEIKLTDFGLAKRISALGAAGDHSQSMTVSAAPAPLTGSIVGTVAYMSPEQAQGQDVDARSDIFSLGVVIHEMVTGRRPFQGESSAALVGDILRGEPKPLREFNSDAPEELQRIVSKALEKDRADRYQTAADLMVDLRRLLRHSSSATHPPITPQLPPGSARRRKLPTWAWIAAAVAALMLALIIAALATAPPAPSELEVEQLTFSSDLKAPPIFTDGTRLYFNEADKPVEMSVTGGAAAPSRASLGDMRFVDISPDGSQWLALKLDVNDESHRGTLWTMPVLGGAPRRLTNDLSIGGSFSPDGTSIAYAGLLSVGVMGADGANPREIWKSSIAFDDAPRFSPDSKILRATLDNNGQTKNVDFAIWEVGVDGKNPHPLDFGLKPGSSAYHGMWTPDGKHFVFLGGENFTTVVFEGVDPRPWEFWKKRSAKRISPQKIDVMDMVPSRDNSKLYAVGRLPQATIMAFDPREKRWSPYLGGLSASEVAVSPDKKWIAYVSFPQATLWRERRDGSDRLQLANQFASMPAWSPDSTQIAFSDFQEIYKVSNDGGPVEKLTSEGHQEVGPAFSPDGKLIYFADYPAPNPENNRGLKILDLATRKITLMPDTATYHVCSWSPDGKWMVAVATPPKRFVLYSAETGKWTDLLTMKSDWGFWVWAPDSKAIYVGKSAPEPGQKAGVYKLTVPDGKSSVVAPFDGLNIWNGFPPPMLGLAPDGQFLYMNDASAVQIYSMKWPAK
ncbi:MAG: protein kinase [Candidatus Acidiferrales bacterium]